MSMITGVVFPQTEFGNDPLAIRDFAQTAEALGYSHILAYDHVLGANREYYADLQGPYSHDDPFLEPFLLFSFMAAATKDIEFATGIIILPQRQTALVAKQAATLDVLCGGRLRLGVGIGWNWVEYEALGQDFSSRGRRVVEQVELMKELWTRPLVHFRGEWDEVVEAGLNPLPLQRPIPIWFGGHADAVLRRTAVLGDGWMPGFRTAEQARPHLSRLAAFVEEAGRSASQVGIEPRMLYGDGDPDAWRETMEGWRAAGATHLSLNTMYSGFETATAHVDALRRFAEAMF